ncbi:hypothetical protein SCA6_020131 [Theobroma cacao]
MLVVTVCCLASWLPEIVLISVRILVAGDDYQRLPCQDGNFSSCEDLYPKQTQTLGHLCCSGLAVLIKADKVCIVSSVKT